MGGAGKDSRHHHRQNHMNIHTLVTSFAGFMCFVLSHPVTHLYLLGLTCINLDSLELTWTCFDPLTRTWTHLDLLCFTWTHLDSLGLTWSHLVSLGLTWIHLDPLESTWAHSDSLGLIRSHTGRGRGSQDEGKKKRESRIGIDSH